MNRSKNRLQIFLLSGIITLVHIPFSLALDEQVCINGYYQLLKEFHNPANPADLKQLAFNRQRLMEYLKVKKIPAFQRETMHGPIPVILLNKKTYPDLGYLLDDSMGMAASLHPGGGTDHGMFRNKTVLLDLYNPGQRLDAGEIHNTGLAWKDLHEYLAQRKPTSRKIMDMAFLLTDAERDTVNLYQRIRRAAVFRAKYAFYKEDAYWKNLPHMLESGAEHCYTFPPASHGASYCAEMGRFLTQVGLKPFEELKKDPRVVEFLSRAKQIVLSAPWREADQMNHHALLNRPELLALIEPVVGAQKSLDEKIKIMSYLLSIEATTNYMKTLNALEIGTGGGNYFNYNRSRATALFIYDETPGVEEKFFNGSYETKSDYYSFLNDGKNKPL